MDSNGNKIQVCKSPQFFVIYTSIIHVLWSHSQCMYTFSFRAKAVVHALYQPPPGCRGVVDTGREHCTSSFHYVSMCIYIMELICVLAPWSTCTVCSYVLLVLKSTLIDCTFGCLLYSVIFDGFKQFEISLRCANCQEANYKM